jgi:hypothetical protein
VSTRRFKTLLASLMVVGGLGCLTVSGTYAVLNSQQTNGKATFASGTLTFGNTVNTGTTCFSYGAGSTANVNGACSPLMSYNAAAENYPGVPATAKVTIANNGSIGASDLQLFMPSCTTAATPDAPSPGGGNPCAGGADMIVQETDSAGNATFCWYPDFAAGSCSWLDDTLSFFAGATDLSGALDLGSGPAAGATRYFTIGLELPSTASNTLQGQEAVFSLTWHLTN